MAENKSARLVGKGGVTVKAEPKAVVAPKSAGQVVLESVAEWLAGFMAFKDPASSVVLALWALATYKAHLLYVFPYLVITKGEPGCGGSTLLKLIARLAYKPLITAGTSGAALMATLLESVDPSDPSVAHKTLFLDEAEGLAKSMRGSDTNQAFANMGYERGQTIGKRSGPETIYYPAFCPKAFCMIGSTAATLIDRSIIQPLFKSQPSRVMLPWEADAEGKVLAAEIRATWDSVDCANLRQVMPGHLETRDQQIWSAMFGIAECLKLDAATVQTLVRFSTDNCEWKRGGDNIRALVVRRSDVDAGYAGRCLTDLRRVLKSDESAIFSADAVERMQSLDDAPWRTFHGTGLDQTMLAKLLAEAGVKRSNVAGKVKIRGEVKSGYQCKDLR